LKLYLGIVPHLLSARFKRDLLQPTIHNLFSDLFVITTDTAINVTCIIISINIIVTIILAGDPGSYNSAKRFPY
jgi:hypothetical protein